MIPQQPALFAVAPAPSPAPTVPPGFIAPLGKIRVPSVEAAFAAEMEKRLAAQFKRCCEAECAACRGDMADAETKPVKVTDWMLERGKYVVAYVHLVAGGKRVICGANAIRLMNDCVADGERETAQQLTAREQTAPS